MVSYNSRVLTYKSKMFIRLATSDGVCQKIDFACTATSDENVQKIVFLSLFDNPKCSHFNSTLKLKTRNYKF